MKRALALATGLVLLAAPAHAGQIEEPSRTVPRLKVAYAEWMPARGKEDRHYFELNDGSVWIYRGHGPCARANKVPNRICRTVFVTKEVR